MPSAKQKLALGGILQGKSKRQAMIDAGYSEVSSSHPKQNLVESRGFQDLLNDLDAYSIQKFGLSADYKAGTALVDALEANKVQGTANDFVEIPDHKTRIEAAKVILDLKGVGLVAAAKLPPPVPNIQVRVVEYGTGKVIELPKG